MSICSCACSALAMLPMRACTHAQSKPWSRKRGKGGFNRDLIKTKCAKSCNCPGRLVKAGVIPPQHARLFSLISAWAELVGYVGSITLCALRIAAAMERERALTEELHRRKKVRLLCNLRPLMRIFVICEV